MPRQRGPSRSAPAPARPAPARPTAPQRPAGYTSANTQQRRPSSTAATAAPHNNPTPTPPAAAASAPAANAGATQQSAGPGLFGQMASTAAGVAVGSSIGHAVGNWFTGGSSSSAPLEQSASPQAQPPADAQPMDSGLYQSSSNTWAAEHGAPCENDIRSFRKCMDEQDGNMSICGWYLDQL
ncbi:hypothetical protein KEM56_003242, partial [Ascosphaera pollenicola]